MTKREREAAGMSTLNKMECATKGTPHAAAQDCLFKPMGPAHVHRVSPTCRQTFCKAVSSHSMEMTTATTNARENATREEDTLYML